jgi:hypothetical protein
MADTTRPDRSAAEPAPDAAVEQLVDALTAPGTPEELGVEEAYVAAFLAVRDRRDGWTGGRGRTKRRVRIALVGGVAALAVTGTAAALTGSLPGTRATEPAQPSRPVTTPTDSTRSGAEVHASAPWAPMASSSLSSARATTTPAEAPTRSGPLPGRTPPGRGPAVGTGTVNGRGTEAARPSPAPTPQAGTLALVNFCRQFADGHLPVESAGYRALVAAAGSAHTIPAYCASLGSTHGHG